MPFLSISALIPKSLIYHVIMQENAAQSTPQNIPVICPWHLYSTLRPLVLNFYLSSQYNQSDLRPRSVPT